MKTWLKRAVSKLPRNWQAELKRHYFRRQIKRGAFVPNEPEIRRLSEWLEAGDWSIDVGANIGYYALAMARQVGAEGRVIALEPLPDTFELLAANVKATAGRNITLLNVAASSEPSEAAMDLPTFEDTGLANAYQARLADRGTHSVLCVPLDGIPLPHAIKLIKIDAEGHDLKVLEGAERLILKDHPVVIVEASIDGEIADWLRERNYEVSVEPSSSNVIAIPRRRDTARDPMA